ncbi:GAF domain-containing protein [Micromonosporaceae bacterium Da 78-11]
MAGDLGEQHRDAPSLGLSPLSRVRLDELLREMLDRVGEVVASRERLRALLDAVVGIGGDLDLRTVLQRIVAAACELAGARYAALGIVGADRELSDFITHGIDPALHAAIGELPHGRGVLGLLITDPRPVRMPDITEHPRSYGFPPNHPPMHSFLGAPIRIRDQVYGNLYLSEKQGAAEFTDDDEEIVVALAAAAGVAIDNARLFALATRRERWLAAAAEITAVLLGKVRRTEALRLIARRAREVADADLVLVLLYDDAAGQFTVEAVDGPDSVTAGLLGAVITAADTTFLDAVTTPQRMLLDDLREAAPWPVPVPGGPAMVAPLGRSEVLHGVLIVGHGVGHDARSDDDVALLSSFADQAALALERARAQEEREQLVVLEDRERIARDLHDVVIQRLFATGMELQSTVPHTTRPEVVKRINHAVDALDETIRDIRRSIFELRTPVGVSLRTELRDVVDAAAGVLGFRPVLDTSGPVDSAVPDDIVPEILAVVREALTNVARHAKAHTVRVSVRAADGQLAVVVQDDGVGSDASLARGGLVNLLDRAADLGGTFEVRRGEGGGTVLDWRVPLTG